MAEADNRAPWMIVRDMANAYYISQMLYIAAKLGIADLIATGVSQVSALAMATSSHSPSLYRLLRALSSVGVFEERENQTFALNTLANCLRSNAEVPLRANIIYRGEPWFWGAWGNLMHCIKTGEAAFPVVNGMEFFEFCNQNADALNIFQNAMLEGTSGVSRAIVDVYDFSPYPTIIDVGGGYGSLIAAILTKNPNTRGILFDLPQVTQGVSAFLEAAGVLDRCEIILGDFFTKVPSGADCYVLKSVIHDWSAERSEQILHNCRRAMTKEARLILIEHIVPVTNVSHWSKIGDLNTWVITGGRELTAQEYTELLAKTGFKLVNIVDSLSGRCIIEAAPV